MLTRRKVAQILGITVSGVQWLDETKRLASLRNEDGAPRYREEDVEVFARTFKPRWRKPTRKMGERRALRRAAYVGRAVALFLDGRSRAEVIAELGCPVEWIDDAWEELSLTTDEARARARARQREERAAREDAASERAQRALEQQMLRRVFRRTKPKPTH